MTLQFHTRLTADGKQAKVEIQGTAKEVDKLSNELAGVTFSGKGAGKALDGVAQDARQASAALLSANDNAKLLSTTNTKAAGSVANLTAQYNDVFVMMAAGQNPMQLAIQQGTQIGQVFQQAGVKGKDAFGLLLSGATAMVSPINLITIGSIAAGAAMTQWLTSSRRAIKPLAEMVEELEARIADYGKAADLASESTEKLEDRFGQVTPRIREYLKKAAESELQALRLAQRETAAALIAETGLSLPSDGLGDLATIGEMMGFSGWTQASGLFGSGRHERRAIFAEILGGYQDIKDAADKSTDAQIQAAERLRDGLEAGAALTGGVTGQELARLRTVEEYLMHLYEIRARTPNEGREAGNAERAWQQYYTSRTLGEKQLLALQEQARAARVYGPNQSSRLESAEAVQSAQELLSTMAQQNELSRIALVHGADSAELTSARAEAERLAFEEVLNSLDVSEALKEELRQAFENGQLLASLDIETGIWGAATAASQLAANLSEAAAQKAALGAVTDSRGQAARAQIMLDTVGDPVGRAGALAADDFQRSLSDGGYGMISSGRIDRLKSMENQVRQAAEDTAALEEQARSADAAYRKLQTTLNGKGKKSKGKGKSKADELKRQREAVSRLTKSYDRELAILQETDPVQKEMIRNREILANATGAEKQAIEAKIKALQAEKQEQENASAAQDYLRSTGSDLIPDLVRGGDDAANAWQRFARSLEDAAWQALLLGEGPLMNLLGLGGAGGGGGFLGWIGSLLGFADGGMNYGKGGGRDDKNLALLSAGEFTVNAQATAKHRALLEAINSGAPLPGFAAGGINGAAPIASWGGPLFQIIDQSRGVEISPEGEFDPQSGRLPSLVINDRISRGLADKSSSARRTLQQLFGMRPGGPLR